jgi:PAS domain S-box-containing protein
MIKSSTSKNQSKTEIALKESEQRYRTTMMSVGDGVIATDIEGRVEMMNPVAEELTGWKQEKARGKSLEEIFHIINEETRRTVENPVSRVIHEGIVVGLANHTMLIARDGTEHPIADSGAPIHNEKGEITGVVLVFRDQTQERIAQKALQESECKFRETVTYLDEGYYSVTIEGLLLDHNQSFIRILGFEIGQDMTGIKLPDFWQDPEDRKQYLNELKAHGFIRNYLVNAKKKNGEKIVVLMNSHLVKDEKGGLIRIEGTFTDFTRMKVMEETLKESEAKYKALFENAQVGMYRSKIDGSAFLDVNDKCAEIFGFKREELLGAPAKIRWANPVERDKMMRLIKEQGGILNNYEVSVLGKNGEVRDLLASVELHPEEGYLDGTMIDVTERKLAEKQLRKLNRIYSLLSEINQAIVRTRVPEELFKQVCNIAVEQGGFGMAWIGLIDESSKKLRVMAQAGKFDNYFENINISLNGDPLNYCPIDCTLRQGKHNICNIIESKEMASCQKIAWEHGFRSSASFPLKVSDNLRGAMTFYSNEPEFFDEAELKLLDELALDISFAMEYVEKEAGRKLMEEELKTSEERFRTAAESLTDVVFEWDMKEKVDWFGDIDSIMGYPSGEFPRTMEGWAATIHPEDKDSVLAAVDAHLRGAAPYLVEYRVGRKDGAWRWWSARGTALRNDRGEPYKMIGSITDITERKLAEETLRESEARYRTLVENIPQGIFMKDRNYRWVSINENFARNLGIRPKDVVGKVDRDLFPRDIADKYHADDIRVMEKGQTEEFEEESILNGKHVWVNTIKTPVRNEKDEIVGMFGIFWDITERKLAEEELKMSKERLLFATEGANLGIWNWNIVTGELIWSDQCKALFGMPPDETMSYQRFSDALHPDDRERTDKAVKDTLENHKDFDIEYRSLWPDESIHWLAAKGRGFYDATGKAVRLEGIVLDITRRKLEEETLRIKNQVFEDSIASQSIADSSGKITHVNPAFLRLWGYPTKEKAIGNSVGSFFADQADAVPVLEALATHDAWEGEFRAKRTDGTTFISRGFATSLRDTLGELVGYQSTNLDMTKEREAEEEIRKLNAELEDRVAIRTALLEASNKELEAFSYSVSHDLRAPLRHISGYVELLNKHFQSDLPEKGQHYLSSIADSVRIMGILIDDLLQFSKTGRMEMRQSDCDMNEIVKEVIESLSKDNPDRKIEWIRGKLSFVYGDEAMLKLVWMNLLSNAVKFTRTRKKARIEIGVRKEKKELVFFVRDNGVGFDMQYAQKLFGVFQRLHPAEKFEGTGIGLANVHRIVLRHGGRTWAKAEIDKGAEFNFSIPIN